MSKSRSNDEKDKDKEKDKENENQNENNEAADNADTDILPQLPIDQLQLTSNANCVLKSPTADNNSLMVRNETNIPSSPPPSYEHVIEQTRLEHAEAQKQEDAKMEKRQQDSWPGKNTGIGTPTDDHKVPAKGPEILHKSSKEFYRAMAKQWGITCKMSDRCRCLDCQSHYFDCEYEKNEHQKTDGGLGAGTPMFISEVMQGSACVLL